MQKDTHQVYILLLRVLLRLTGSIYCPHLMRLLSTYNFYNTVTVTASEFTPNKIISTAAMAVMSTLLINKILLNSVSLKTWQPLRTYLCIMEWPLPHINRMWCICMLT